jgi:hypothetical protein
MQYGVLIGLSEQFFIEIDVPGASGCPPQAFA